MSPTARPTRSRDATDRAASRTTICASSSRIGPVVGDPPDGRGRRAALDDPDALLGALLDPQADERRVDRVVEDAPANAVDDIDALREEVADPAGHLCLELFARGLDGQHPLDRARRRRERRSWTSWMFRWNGVAWATSARSASSATRSRMRGVDRGAGRRRRARAREPEHGSTAIAEAADREDERGHGYSSPDRSTVVIPARLTWRVTITTVTMKRTSAAA